MLEALTLSQESPHLKNSNSHRFSRSPPCGPREQAWLPLVSLRQAGPMKQASTTHGQAAGREYKSHKARHAHSTGASSAEPLTRESPSIYSPRRLGHGVSMGLLGFPRTSQTYSYAAHGHRNCFMCSIRMYPTGRS